MDPLRVMLDSNAFNSLAWDDEAIRLRVEVAVSSGALVLVTTTIQIDENNRIADEAKRLGIQRISVAGTYAPFVVGISRLGASVLASDEEVAIYDEVMADNPQKCAEDAAILIAARREGIPVITKDKRLLNRCRKHGVVGMRPAELLELLP